MKNYEVLGYMSYIEYNSEMEQWFYFCNCGKSIFGPFKTEAETESHADDRVYSLRAHGYGDCKA